MTPAASLLAAARLAAFTLRTEGGRLLVGGGPVPDDWAAAFREHKAALIAILENETAKAKAAAEWEKATAGLETYQPDFSGGPVVCAEVAVVDLGNGRKVALDAVDWDAFKADVTAWNAGMGDRCPHARTTYYRKSFANGGGFHLVKWCLDCDRNVLGAGRWAAKAEVENAEVLPELPEAKGGDKAAGLFQAEGKT